MSASRPETFLHCRLWRAHLSSLAYSSSTLSTRTRHHQNSAQDRVHRQAALNRIFLLSANEQKWLVRIILQDMKIGLREEQILGF